MRHILTRGLHRLEYVAAYVARAALRALPLPAARTAAAAAARTVCPILPFDARARRNLALVRPDESPAERRRIRRGLYDSFARTLVEYQHVRQMIDDPSMIHVRGAEHPLAAQEAGRGAVFVTAHFGNWEMIRVALRRMGQPCALIYRAFNNPLVDAEAAHTAALIGEPIFHKGRAGLRGLVRHVGRGGAVLILIDQRFNGAPAIPFLGRPALTSTAAAEIALSRGAAFIPARGQRRPDGVYDVVFEPPIAPPPDAASPQDAALAMTSAANARLSAWIEAAPEQWFWLHNRWGKPGRLISQESPDGIL